jgi:hypothetical protein
MWGPMSVIFTVTNFRRCAVRPSLPYVGMSQPGMGDTTTRDRRYLSALIHYTFLMWTILLVLFQFHGRM